eukprot:6191805-Pleurochrysis_carterae.AAC.3
MLHGHYARLLLFALINAWRRPTSPARTAGESDNEAFYPAQESYLQRPDVGISKASDFILNCRKCVAFPTSISQSSGVADCGRRSRILCASLFCGVQYDALRIQRL